MSTSPPERRARALSIWQAAVDAADPERLVRAALEKTTPPPNPLPETERGSKQSSGSPLRFGEGRGGGVFSPEALHRARRILVVGGGKAGAAMAAGVEAALADRLDCVHGLLNVPEGTERPLSALTLHAGRPAGVNQPTEAGVAGVERMLELVSQAGPGDVGLCLLSGGGSALLPAPAEGVSLADKQAVTALLHACGATIDEMNCVRKHLSRIKGGRLAQAFAERGVPLTSLIVSDVIGDPLDVIASGPTAPDPTTFADAWEVLTRYALLQRVPTAVRAHLERGRAGAIPDTPKTIPPGVCNCVLGNNARSLTAASVRATELGYQVLNLGAFLDGETRALAIVQAGLVRSLQADALPLAPPVCVLSGGETTVTLGSQAGKGGRNQEFVLALLNRLGPRGMAGVVALSGGTDGEDGPTDAAGAVADEETLLRAAERGLDVSDYLDRHDAYPFFDALGGLVRTGLTGTNVMDVRVLLVEAPTPAPG